MSQRKREQGSFISRRPTVKGLCTGERERLPVRVHTGRQRLLHRRPLEGEQVWEINKRIAKELHETGQVWKIDYIRHSYPHCHRCGTKLLYRAHPSWFMNIDGQREEMLEQNGDINWFPGHVKQGPSLQNGRIGSDWNPEPRPLLGYGHARLERQR